MGKKKMVSKGVLIEDIKSGATIWQLMKKYEVSKNTIRNHMKRHGILTPKGFFKKEGAKIGRPKGILCLNIKENIFVNYLKARIIPFMGRNTLRPPGKRCQIITLIPPGIIIRSGVSF